MPNLSPDFYQTLFEHAPIGLALCRLDDSGDLVNVNAAYANILGRSVAETLQLSYWQITPRKYERDEHEQLDAIRQHRRYGPYEKEYIHKDGHLVPVRLSGVVVDIGGQTYLWSQVEDMSEERYRRLFQEAAPALALCDLDGRLLVVNKAYADLLGRTIDDTVGLSFWNMTPRQFDERESRIRGDLEKKGQFGPYSTKYRKSAGDPIDVTLYGLGIKLHGRSYILAFVEKGSVEEIEAEQPYEWIDQPARNCPDQNRPIKE